MENNQNPAILVLGASGTIGRQVVKELEGGTANVRITSRSPRPRGVSPCRAFIFYL